MSHATHREAQEALYERLRKNGKTQIQASEIVKKTSEHVKRSGMDNPDR